VLLLAVVGPLIVPSPRLFLEQAPQVELRSARKYLIMLLPLYFDNDASWNHNHLKLAQHWMKNQKLGQ
jgi:hypothetical protein